MKKKDKKNSLKKFKNQEFRGERDDFLLNESFKKRVIHFGCTDWPFQQEQIAGNNFLHAKLLNTTESIIGVDIDRIGISNLIEIFPQDEFLIGDISQNKELIYRINEFKPEILLIPDVIEHLSNPAIFLQSISEILSANSSMAIFTTPNAYSIKTFIPTLAGLDATHFDHCHLHNEFTLKRLMEIADLKVAKIYYCNRNISTRYGTGINLISRVIDIFTRLIPKYADTLVFLVLPTKN